LDLHAFYTDIAFDGGYISLVGKRQDAEYLSRWSLGIAVRVEVRGVLRRPGFVLRVSVLWMLSLGLQGGGMG